MVSSTLLLETGSLTGKNSQDRVYLVKGLLFGAFVLQRLDRSLLIPTNYGNNSLTFTCPVGSTSQ